MILTANEREAVERGDLVPFVIPESSVECVIVRRDRLDPLLLNVDYSPCPPDDLLRMTAECLDEEDWSEFDQPPTSKAS